MDGLELSSAKNATYIIKIDIMIEYNKLKKRLDINEISQFA